MKKNKESEAFRWLVQAKRDLDDAEYSRKGERYNLACFLAQQSSEKALKAYLFYMGAEEVWGHSVAELSHNAADFDNRFADLGKTAAALDKYYIPTRYPNGLPGGIPSDAFIKEDADQAIKITNTVIDLVNSIIEP